MFTLFMITVCLSFLGSGVLLTEVGRLPKSSLLSFLSGYVISLLGCLLITRLPGYDAGSHGRYVVMLILGETAYLIWSIYSYHKLYTLTIWMASAAIFLNSAYALIGVKVYS